MARKNIQILRTKKVLIAFFSYIIICTMDISAQIAEFTQIYNNYVYLNPAFVGTTSCPHVFSSYRSKNFSQARYSTAYLSFDVDMKQSLGSCGFSLLHDSVPALVRVCGTFFLFFPPAVFFVRCRHAGCSVCSVRARRTGSCWQTQC